MSIKEKIKQHLAQLAPHVAAREAAELLRGAVAEIERLEAEMKRRDGAYADDLERLAVEIETLRQGAVNVHDAILHGYDDKTLLDMLTEMYSNGQS